MKSFAASLLLFALVGSAMCARLRRQAAPAPPAEAVAAGAPEGGSAAAAEPSPFASAKADLLKAVLNKMVGDEEAKKADGEAADTGKLDALSGVIGMMGGSVDKSTEDRIDALRPEEADADAASVADSSAGADTSSADSSAGADAPSAESAADAPSAESAANSPSAESAADASSSGASDSADASSA